MKGTEAWEQHGELSREKTWQWVLLYFSKAWYLLEAGKQEPWGRWRGLSFVMDDHCNFLAQGSQGTR